MARKTAETAGKEQKKRVRTNQLLVYMDPNVAAALKRLALRDETNTSQLVEMACRQFLRRQGISVNAKSED